jgi:hypothetical protein
MIKLFLNILKYLYTKVTYIFSNETSKNKQLFDKRQTRRETRIYLWSLLNTEFYRSTFFVKRYKKLNDLLWQDGFLIDFLQKKIVDKWLRNFVIFSGNLFSERLLFDNVIRFLIDFIFKPTSYFFIFESNSPTHIILINIQLLVLFFLLTSLLYLSLILF